MQVLDRQSTDLTIIRVVNIWGGVLNRMTVSIFMAYFNSLFNFTLIRCSVIIADSLLSDGNHVTV